MKQGKDRLISAASLFSLIIASVCGVWWLYAPTYQNSLGTAAYSPMLQKPLLGLILIIMIAGLIAVIFVYLFRKKLPFIQLRVVIAVILITLFMTQVMKTWAIQYDHTNILVLFAPCSFKWMAENYWMRIDAYLAFDLTWTLAGILLFVLIVRKEVHWGWTAVRMTILANLFAIGSIHGGMRSLYPYVLEILIEILIAEQIIQGIQHWIEKGKGESVG